MSIKRINIAREFSIVPAGRFEKDGPYNGTKFRRKFLKPALDHYKSVEVDLEGTEGFGSSFLEEAFGGLVRVEGYPKDLVKRSLHLKPDQGPPRIERYKRLIQRYIEEAKPNG